MRCCGRAVLQCCSVAVKAVQILIQLRDKFVLRASFSGFHETLTGF